MLELWKLNWYELGQASMLCMTEKGKKKFKFHFFIKKSLIVSLLKVYCSHFPFLTHIWTLRMHFFQTYFFSGSVFSVYLFYYWRYVPNTVQATHVNHKVFNKLGKEVKRYEFSFTVINLGMLYIYPEFSELFTYPLCQEKEFDGKTVWVYNWW